MDQSDVPVLDERFSGKQFHFNSERMIFVGSPAGAKDDSLVEAYQDIGFKVVGVFMQQVQKSPITPPVPMLIFVMTRPEKIPHSQHLKAQEKIDQIEKDDAAPAPSPIVK